MNPADNMKEAKRRVWMACRITTLLVVAGLICCCILVAGCDRKIGNKNRVFYDYFHESAPTNANIILGTNWEVYGVGLEESELVLEATLPNDFLDSALPITAAASPPAPSDLEALLGDTNASCGVIEAMKEQPPWFNPADPSQFSIITNNVRLSYDTGFVTITFADRKQTNRYQLWLSDRGWNRLFVDRQTGHIYAHHKTF